MPSKIATVGVDRSHAPTYFRRARQLCEAAAAEFASERYDAALILAIHAGISAADSVCIGVGTRRNKESHERAADLLEEVGGHAAEFVEGAKRLRTLLSSKTAIEYENKRATQRDAEVGLRRCEALVSWAETTLRTAKLVS
jgi:HEPN domain-containing protein